jgi:hypothetical protein
METIAVNLDFPIRWFLEEGRIGTKSSDGIGFGVTGFYDLDLVNNVATPIVTDNLPLDHVCRLRSCSGGAFTGKGKRGGDIYLNPKGYKFIRPRFIAYIEQHKPIAIRGDQSPITIEQIDAIFSLWWLSVLAATQKDLEKAESKVAAIKQGLASLEKIKLAEMFD